MYSGQSVSSLFFPCLRPMMVSSSPWLKPFICWTHRFALSFQTSLQEAPDWHEQPAAHCPAGILNSQAQTRTSGLPTPRPLPLLPRPPLSRDFPTALAHFSTSPWGYFFSAPHRPSATMVPTITPRPEDQALSFPAHSSKQHTSDSRFCLSLERLVVNCKHRE